MFENLSQLVGATGMVTSGSFRRRQIACHNGRNSGRPTRARQAASEEGGRRRERVDHVMKRTHAASTRRLSSV